MGRKVIQLKNWFPDQIKSIFSKDDKYTVGYKLYAIYQVALGKSPRHLQDVYNTSFKQIIRWVHSFDEHGLEGLKSKKKPGRTPRISQDQREEIKKMVTEKSPEDYGINTRTWTGPILIDVMKREFGIHYQKAQIYNILHRLGFSYQKGKGIYPESDPAQQKEFGERLKKTPRK